jgi:outer membrane immunogenic protein
MNKILFAAIGALALTSVPAVAADMPVKAPRTAVAVVYDWTGFYVGANAGYSWGRTRGDLDGTVRRQVFRTAGPDLIFDSGLVAAPFSDRDRANGWVGGGQIGYNVQSSNWLFGLEADIQKTGEKSSSDLAFGIPAVFIPGAQGTIAAQTLALGIRQKLDWFATFRARAGLLASERLLIYGTGGLAVGHLESNYTFGSAILGTTAVATDRTRAGWVVGAGAEAALWDRWTAKVEFLHMDLGRFDGGSVAATVNQLATPGVGFNTVTTFTGTARARFTDNILRVGLNYRFGGGPVVARY